MASAAPFMLAASAASALGSITQGQMTSGALNAQAQVQQQNAQEAEVQGQFNATKQSLNSAEKIGSITAAFGASGVSSQSGSVQNVLAASASNAELDRLNILHGADVRAINYTNQASMDKLGASSALQGSYFSALGSLTKGAAGALGNSISASPSGGGTPITNSGFGMPVESAGGTSYGLGANTSFTDLESTGL